MEENDTKLTPAYLAENQVMHHDEADVHKTSNQIGTISLFQHYGRMIIDPFGLLRKVIATATFPELIEQLSLYVMLTITALWDIIIVMAITTVVFKLLTVICYCIKKFSRFICFVTSGKNKRALRRVLWNKQQKIVTKPTKQ